MLYLVTLEPIDTRYTSQWKKWIKEYFKDSRIPTEEIDGSLLETSKLNGTNFLSPIDTNIWKSEQILKICQLYKNNKISNDDKFLFYDAWHYGLIAIEYMNKLLNLHPKTYGIWHAGSYDKTDLLGQVGMFETVGSFENSLFNILDKSFVASNYHKSLIESKFKKTIDLSKVKVTGFPFNFADLDKYKDITKENIIVFPHRLSKEKQPEIFEDMFNALQKFGVIRCVITQKLNLDKDSYYKLLARSKCVFSTSLHENWGISTFEGLYLGCIPILPNRTSYKEMYYSKFKYPSDWSIDFKHYKKHKKELINFILDKISNYNNLKYSLKSNSLYIKENYCEFNNIIKEVTC